jgi:hypothetical protein
VGRIEYMAVMRHRRAIYCIVDYLAFYLFIQWNLSREPVPNF